MATLTNKTDEIAALETLREDLAKYEKSLIEKKDSPEKVKQSIKIKIADIRKQIREGKTTDREVTAKQLADSLLRSRKKFLEMSKKDFNGVLRQLAKKPEYAFLKGMTRQEVIDDIQRKAKPVGWRFKGRENFKTPTPQQVRRGRANGMVYYENRANRADVSQTKQLEKGGSTYQGGGEILSGKFNARISVPYNFEGRVKDQYEFESFLSKALTKKWFGYGVWGVKITKPLFKQNNNQFIEVEIEIPYRKIDNYELTQFISKALTKKWFGNGVWGVEVVSTYAKGGSTYQGGGEVKEGDRVIITTKSLGKQYEGITGEVTSRKLLNDKYSIKLENGMTMAFSKNEFRHNSINPRYAKGGSLKGHGLAIGDEILNVYRDDVYVYNRGVVYMLNLSNGKRTMTKMSKDDAISTFENGGSVSMSMSQLQAMREADFDFDIDEDDSYDDGVTRHYFEDEAYSYEDGGEVDVDDLNIPVHYTMFEDEMYEYARGGYVSKGEMVWNKLSQSKRMEFLYTHFTPQITPRSQEILVGKNWNFLPKNVKIKFEAVYANEDY